MTGERSHSLRATPAKGSVRLAPPGSLGEPVDRTQHLVAALCHLDSSAAWVTMRRELGMSGRDIADAATWAAEAILDPIRVAGHGA